MTVRCLVFVIVTFILFVYTEPPFSAQTNIQIYPHEFNNNFLNERPVSGAKLKLNVSCVKQQEFIYLSPAAT